MGTTGSRLQKRERLFEMKNYANILMEGVLFKQSKYLKEWRERKILLTSTKIVTFPTSRKLNMPCSRADEVPDELSTLEIRLKDITSIKKYEQNRQYYLEIATPLLEARFKTFDKSQSEEWYHQISSTLHNLESSRSGRSKQKQCGMVRAATTREGDWGRITNNDI